MLERDDGVGSQEFGGAHRVERVRQQPQDDIERARSVLLLPGPQAAPVKEQDALGAALLDASDKLGEHLIQAGQRRRALLFLPERLGESLDLGFFLRSWLRHSSAPHHTSPHEAARAVASVRLVPHPFWGCQ